MTPANPSILDQLLTNGWLPHLEEVFASSKVLKLKEFLKQRRRESRVYPPAHHVFRAICDVPLKSVKVVIVGQDPYHGPNQANGYAFAINKGCTRPHILRNIIREVEEDIGTEIPNTAVTLEGWAQQGVLLLNSILTTEEGSPLSHINRGWEEVTDEIVRVINRENEWVVFLLLGKCAQKKDRLVDVTKHSRVVASYPSSRGVQGFFGQRPFSQINDILERYKRKPIDWSKVDLEEKKNESGLEDYFRES